MNFVDTHAHLYWESYKPDLDEVLKRAKDAGVTAIINIGVDIEKSKEALEQVQTKLANIPGLSFYSTIAIHPHEALRYSQGKLSDVDIAIQKDMEKLEQIYLSDTTKVVGVGECGLDYVFTTNDLHPNISLPSDQIKKLQKQLFQAQIDLAEKLNLPLVVHCRDDRSKNPENSECWDKAINMTKNHFGVYHCYSGLPQTTNYLLQATSFFIAFAANITYPKNDYLREAAKIIPLERILLETDSPFLSPQSKRGQRNEPSSVKEIAQLIADLKGVSLEEVASQTTKNAKKVFKV